MFDKYFYAMLLASFIGGVFMPNLWLVIAWGVLCAFLAEIARKNKWLD